VSTPGAAISELPLCRSPNSNDLAPVESEPEPEVVEEEHVLTGEREVIERGIRASSAVSSILLYSLYLLARFWPDTLPGVIRCLSAFHFVKNTKRLEIR
jgi:hypothetical protein